MIKYKTFAVRSLTLASAAFFVVSQAHAIDIVATYDSTISGNSAAMSTIQSAINFFDNLYTGSTQVRIAFQNGGGLGSSETFGADFSYSAYHTALMAHSSGNARDAAALLQLDALPFTGSNVHVTTALARELGLDNYTGPVDSTITLNLSACFTGHSNPVAGQYDLWAVAAHEIDEAMGTSSGLPNDPGSIGTPYVADLFRYEGTNVRNYDTDTSKHVFFSIDGTHNLIEYNHFGRTGGDWGDWADQSPAQVQDAFGTSGVVVNYGANETALLDVVGWNTQAVPEPMSMTLLGLGAAAIIRRRKRS